MRRYLFLDGSPGGCNINIHSINDKSISEKCPRECAILRVKGLSLSEFFPPPHSFHIFSRIFVFIFQDFLLGFFLPLVCMGTSNFPDIFLLLKEFTNCHRTPPYLDTHFQKFYFFWKF